jgi:hypothetical protein
MASDLATRWGADMTIDLDTELVASHRFAPTFAILGSAAPAGATVASDLASGGAAAGGADLAGSVAADLGGAGAGTAAADLGASAMPEWLASLLPFLA